MTAWWQQACHNYSLLQVFPWQHGGSRLATTTVGYNSVPMTAWWQHACYNYSLLQQCSYDSMVAACLPQLQFATTVFLWQHGGSMLLPRQEHCNHFSAACLLLSDQSKIVPRQFTKVYSLWYFWRLAQARADRNWVNTCACLTSHSRFNQGPYKWSFSWKLFEQGLLQAISPTIAQSMKWCDRFHWLTSFLTVFHKVV